MREILFRGKQIYNGEWVYGMPISSQDGLEIVFEIYHVDGGEWNVECERVDPSTVGQFTGLLDKNGVKIFEGDLLELCGNKNGLLTVEFKNQYVGGWVCTHHTTNDHASLGARIPYEVEVKGNIHDK